MNNKLLMYMMTGNIYFLFLPTQTALMMMMMSGGNIQTPSSSVIPLGQSSNLNSLLPLLLLSGAQKRRYPRRTIIRRYYRGRRW